MADGAASKISQDKASIKTKERSPDAPFRHPQIGSYDSMLSLSSLIGNQAAGQLFQFQESDSVNPNPPLPGIVQKILNSNTGKPLDPATRSYMESRFNHDFSQVRIHTDAGAAESARAINAVAYTVNQDVVFGGNAVSLGTEAGQHVLAHELAHVVQQGRSNDSNILSSTANHSLEESADRAAKAFTEGGGTVQVDGASAPGLACLTVQEAEQKLGRFVPSFIKQRAKPLVESLHTVIDPKAELPKPAEKIVDQTEAAAAVVLSPTPAAAPSPPPSDASNPPSANSQKPPTVENSKSKEASVGMLTKATEGLKGLVRDKALEGIGTVKGVVTQVTEVADTVLWLGGEYKELRDKAAEAIGGETGSIGNQFVSGSIDAATFIIPGAQSLKSLADANEQAKAAGLIDKQTGQASLTAPLSDQLNEAGKWVESKVGGTPSDSFLFTPMERAELEAAIGTQVALAFTGVEEVKVAMNVLGALGGLRGVVERIRANPDGWHKDAAFWSSLIGMALSVVGLKHTMAASKITTIILKFGWIAAAIPPLTQMAADYTQLSTNTGLSKEDREKLDKRMKQDWTQAVHVLKDAILHVAQSQRGKSANSAIEPSTSPSRIKVTTTGEMDGFGTSGVSKSTKPLTVEPSPPTTDTTSTQTPLVKTTKPTQQPASDILPKPPVNIEGDKIIPFKGAGENVSQPKPPTSPKSTSEGADILPKTAEKVPGGGKPPSDGFEDFLKEFPDFKAEGPMVRVRMSEDPKGVKPSEILEIGAGSKDVDLGIPPGITQDPKQGTVNLTKTDILPRKGVSELDATKPVPPELIGKADTIIVNNPRGYTPNIAELGKALSPGGRIIIQGTGKPPGSVEINPGRAEVTVGGKTKKVTFNPDFQKLLDAEVPPGFRRVSIEEIPPPPYGEKTPESQILGSGFRSSEGDRPVAPNARIVIEKVSQ
jgi:hypothetical protein